MRESALFGTMFGLGAGAVLAGVTVSRLVVGQVPEKSAVEPPALAAETASPAVVASPAPAVVSSAAPSAAEVAVGRQRRALPRKHRRPPGPEEAAPTPAPVVKQTPPAPPAVVEQTPPTTASTATHEAPVAAPPPAPVTDTPIAPDAPIAIVRGGVARPGLPAPGARIIQVEPQDGAP